MDRINGADTVDIGGGRRGFVDEDLVVGRIGTEVTALWLNMTQEEIIKVIEGAGLALNPGDWTQLWQAIRCIQMRDGYFSVTDRRNDPPGAPAVGDRYIVGAVPTGAWVGHKDEIALWLGAWVFIAPTPWMHVGFADRKDWRWDHTLAVPAWVEWKPQATIAGPISLDDLDKRIANSAAVFGGCYLDVIGGVMKLSPEGGGAVFINGSYRALPPAGATLAAAPGSNELFHLWAYWTGAAVAIEASSATVAPKPPVADPTYGHLVKTGDPSRTYVGIARSGAATAWQGGLLVSSHFNKKLKTVTLERASPVTRSGSLSDIDATMWIWFVSDEDVVSVRTQAAQKSDSIGNRTLFQVEVAAQSGSYCRNQNTNYTPVMSTFEATIPRGYFAALGKHGGDGTATTDNYEINLSKFG